MPTYHTHQLVSVRGNPGTVIAVIPACRDPMRELRRLFGKTPPRVHIPSLKRRRDAPPLRDHESYIVEVERGGRKWLVWPRVCDVSEWRAVDG